MNKETFWYSGTADDSVSVYKDKPDGSPTEDVRHTCLCENAHFIFSLSLVLGAVYALCFFHSEYMGINVFVFSVSLCAVSTISLRRLGLSNKKRNIFWSLCIGLLGFSVAWTANESVQLISFLGIILSEMFWVMSASDNVLLWRLGRVIAGCFRLMGRTATHLPEPFRHMAKPHKTDGCTRNVLLGLCIAVPLCLVILSLLSDADAAFASLIRHIIGGSVPSAIKNAFQCIITVFVVAVVFYSSLAAQTDHGECSVREKKRASSVIAVTFTLALAVIYAVFCGIQVVVLFAGNASALPANMTYAEYAREGFFQLLIVSGINVLLIIYAQSCFASSKMLRSLLLFLSVCTYIMEASSAMRMILYVNVYGLTFLRIFVLWFLVLLAVLLGAALYTVFHPDFHLFRFAFISCMVFWLLFAFARSERIAAKYNFEHYSPNDAAAWQFINDCSLDAVPALRPYFDFVTEDNAEGYFKLGIPDDYKCRGVRGFNISAWEAMQTAEDYTYGK